MCFQICIGRSHLWMIRISNIKPDRNTPCFNYLYYQSEYQNITAVNVLIHRKMSGIVSGKC